jgi:hypothetical protein
MSVELFGHKPCPVGAKAYHSSGLRCIAHHMAPQIFEGNLCVRLIKFFFGDGVPGSLCSVAFTGQKSG